MKTAVLLAAGTGKRVGANVPKQFIKINGKSILRWCLDNFIHCEVFDEIIVVSHKDYIETTKKIVGPKVKVIEGGKDRHESLLKGVKAASPGRIVSHDVARPFTSKYIIMANANSSITTGTYVRSVDSMLYETNGYQNLVRSNVLVAQTPQAFERRIFLEIAGKYNPSFHTDAISIFVERGYDLNVVDGDSSNFKVTTDLDVRLAKALMGE